MLLVAQEEAGISITGKLVSEFPAPVGSSPKLSPPSFSIPSLLHCVHPSSTNNVDYIKMYSVKFNIKI